MVSFRAIDLTYVLCFRWLKVNCGDPVDGCVVNVPLLLSENVTGQNIDKIRKRMKNLWRKNQIGLSITIFRQCRLMNIILLCNYVHSRYSSLSSHTSNLVPDHSVCSWCPMNKLKEFSLKTSKEWSYTDYVVYQFYSDIQGRKTSSESVETAMLEFSSELTHVSAAQCAYWTQNVGLTNRLREVQEDCLISDPYQAAWN